jgi:phosphatidate phosphatase APP1
MMSLDAPPVVPASCVKLDRAEVERVLVEECCNVTVTARRLRVPPQDLRAMVRSTSSLADTVREAVEQTLDEAEQIVRDALKSDDKPRQLQAAKAWLTRSNVGERNANR